MSDPGDFAPVWATTANFPAGANPWNGQPTKNSPPYIIWIPDLPLPADHLNYLMNARDVYMNALHDWAAPVVNNTAFGVMQVVDAGGTITTQTWNAAYLNTQNVVLQHVTGIQHNDIVDASISLALNAVSAPTAYKIRIGYSTDSTTGTDGTWTELNHSERLGEIEVGGHNNIVSTLGQYTVGIGITSVWLAIQVDGSVAAISMPASSEYSGLVRVYRPAV